MPSADYYYPYAPHRAPSLYATHATRGWVSSQMGPSSSHHSIYNNPAWNLEHDSRDRTRDMTRQVYNESAALAMQEELDLAQAIANSTHTAEREAKRHLEREASDRRQMIYTAPQMHLAHSISSNISTRSRRSRPLPEEPQMLSDASFRAGRYVCHQSASPAEKLFEYDTTFTADFRCPRCKQLIVTSQIRLQRYSSSAISLLHMRCPACSTVYCRGCALITECPPRCTGGDHCPLTKCCNTVRAVAIFEALSDLDKAYANEAEALADSSPPSRSQREEYLELIISRADPILSTAFDRVLLHALTEVNLWMPEKPYKAGDVHPSVALLLSSSYILEIVHHYLSQPKAGDWVIRADIYLHILTLMRTLAARTGLVHLVMEPRNIKQACGLHNIIWTKGKILSEDGPDASSSLYCIIMSPTNDRSQDFLKLQESLRSIPLKERAWSLQKQIQYLQLLQVSGPDY